MQAATSGELLERVSAAVQAIGSADQRQLAAVLRQKPELYVRYASILEEMASVEAEYLRLVKKVGAHLSLEEMKASLRLPAALREEAKRQDREQDRRLKRIVTTLEEVARALGERSTH
ncbi:MAG TPA: hypothetical protein VD907_04590 [Verrucomicrobiae bacterium]|nr:hypothetical protein [Verrucomicrobiae bacterium]